MKLIVNSLVMQGISREDAIEQYYDALEEAEEYPDDVEDIFFCNFFDLNEDCRQEFLKDVEDDLAKFRKYIKKGEMK